MAAYYNEIEPFAAQWLRNLIAAGHIAPGDVDDRSIEDVRPGDLDEYTQCHFFAGIGIWSLALRNAGWPNDRPVWTGSCPCQPFSAAGKGAGTADERHLWPAWFHLIEQCRPSVVFGEQVEAAIKHGWLDLVQADLEGVGYSVGAAGLPAAGFGAPHSRSRLWFVAHSDDSRPKGWFVRGNGAEQRAAGTGGVAGGMGHPGSSGRQRREEAASRHVDVGSTPERPQGKYGASESSTHRVVKILGIPDSAGCGSRCETAAPPRHRDTTEPADRGEPGPVNGFWRDADWLPCKDGKLRPTQPGLFPLAHGASQRVGRLRGYGNAIVAPVAEAFIRAYLDAAA